MSLAQTQAPQSRIEAPGSDPNSPTPRGKAGSRPGAASQPRLSPNDIDARLKTAIVDLDEAMALLHRLNPKAGNTFVVDADCHPQTIDVMRTRLPVAEVVSVE